MTTKTKKTWRKVRLGEIVNVFGGGTPSTHNPEYWGGDISWLTPAEVSGFSGRFIEKTRRNISEAGLKNSSAKLMPANSLLLTSRATIGDVVINKVPMATNQGFINILPNKEVDRQFLFYWLKRKREYFNRIAVGSTFLELIKSVFKKIEIELPDLNEQKRIAKILSAFDDKIELNNKINQNLEQMAQAIFKEWFAVPSEALAKEGELPKGWEVKKITEIIKRLPVGKKYDNKNTLPKGEIPVLDQGQSGFIGFHNEEPGIRASVKNPVVVFTNHTCYYRLITFDFSCIQNVIPYIGVKGYSTLFVYFLTKNKIRMSDYKGHWPEFAAQKFVIPPKEVALEFSKKIQPSIEIIDKNQKENQTLASLRDLLLPKLMSGETRV